MSKTILAYKKAAPSDMYPLYWTTSKGGIFMRYSYEFKRKAIELFNQGEWPETVSYTHLAYGIAYDDET